MPKDKHFSFAIFNFLMVKKIKSVLIWDAPDPPLNEECDVILWREVLVEGLRDNFISIPDLVEKNSLYLRNQYLAWIYDLGKYKVHGGKSAIEYLALKNGPSFWWMTELSEKCNHSKSTYIDDALYLKAFENWAFSKNTKEIVMVSSNQKLSECLKQWCNDKNIIFKLISPSSSFSQKNNLSELKLYFLQGIISLIWYLWERWSFKGEGLNEWTKSSRSTTIVSYFLNINQELIQTGVLDSKYWDSLPKILNECNRKINWFHFFEKSSETPTVLDAKNKLKLLNRCAASKDIHVVAESFLSIRIIFSSIKEWLIIRKKCENIEGIFSKKYFGGFNLEPLYLTDWKKYCYGSGSLHAILKFNLLNKAFSILQAQEYGIYLQENQNWEFGFIRAWKNYHHGSLIGFPHSTVRFWDLRYFMDRRVYREQDWLEFPLPDVVGVNGPHALKLLIEAGFPQKKLVKVESLRFLHLNGGAKKYNKNFRSSNKEISMLVVTDIVRKQALLQLNLLDQAIRTSNLKIKILLKPHPGSQSIANEYPNLDIAVTMDSISNLVAKCDIAYVGNITTAALDISLSGMPLITFYDPRLPNYSPLRGHKGISFVSKPKDIIDAVNSFKNLSIENINSNEYFYLNDDLKLWKLLLNIPPSSQNKRIGFKNEL